MSAPWIEVTSESLLCLQVDVDSTKQSCIIFLVQGQKIDRIGNKKNLEKEVDSREIRRGEIVLSKWGRPAASTPRELTHERKSHETVVQVKSTDDLS